MSLRAWALGLGLCAATGALACGDDDANGVGTGDGGVPLGGNGGGAGARGGAELPGSVARGSRVADLTETQIGDLCQAIDAELSRAVTEDDAERLSCTLFALLTSLVPGQGGGQASVDPVMCEEAVADCVGSGLMGTSETTCEPERVPAAAEGCDVTVGEYFDCLQADIDRLAAALDAITCETLADPDVAAMAFADDFMDPSSDPACADIARDCPALLEGDSDPSVSPPAEDGCDDTCSDAMDGYCDDGGPDADFDLCGLGTDCTDCGPR